MMAIDPKVQRQLYFDQIPEPSPESVVIFKSNAYPMAPGSGPEGETCGSCEHSYRRRIRSGRAFWKCELMRETRGAGTDIKKRAPACGRWEPIKETEDE